MISYHIYSSIVRFICVFLQVHQNIFLSFVAIDYHQNSLQRSLYSFQLKLPASWEEIQLFKSHSHWINKCGDLNIHARMSNFRILSDQM